MKTKELAYTALIAGIIFICLTFINIRIYNSVLSLGFCVVFSTAIVFGGKSAGLGCGIGAMIFDIVGGYANYAPFTFLAYGLAALVIGVILEKNFSVGKIALAVVLGILIKLFVYLIANYIYYGLPYAISVIPLEIVNSGLGAILGIPLGKVLKKAMPKIDYVI